MTAPDRAGPRLAVPAAGAGRHHRGRRHLHRRRVRRRRGHGRRPARPGTHRHLLRQRRRAGGLAPGRRPVPRRRSSATRSTTGRASAGSTSAGPRSCGRSSPNASTSVAGKGFTGVEADNVDGYTQDSGFHLTGDDQLRFNRMLAALAHERSLTIGLKNDLDQIDDLVDEFDFAVQRELRAVPRVRGARPVHGEREDGAARRVRAEHRRLLPRHRHGWGSCSIRKPVELTAPVGGAHVVVIATSGAEAAPVPALAPAG